MAPLAFDRFQDDSLTADQNSRFMGPMSHLPLYRLYDGALSRMGSDHRKANKKPTKQTTNVFSKAINKVGKMCSRDKGRNNWPKLKTLNEESECSQSYCSRVNTKSQNSTLDRNVERFGGQTSKGLLIACPSYEQLNTAHNNSFSSDFHSKRCFSWHSFPRNINMPSSVEPDMEDPNLISGLYNNSSHIYTSPTNTLPSCSGATANNSKSKPRFLANKQVAF